MPGKVILVKSADGKLVTTRAISYETDTGTVNIIDPVDMGNGNITKVIPRELCFQFNPDLQSMVNRLVVVAEQNLVAAAQIMATEAREEVFDGDDRPVVMH